MPSLGRYRAKRDPSRTPEPVPASEPASQQDRPHHKSPRTAPSRAPAFVVQEHHARSLHWDLRLERDGVFVSWAVPKGLPPDRGTNHLAVHVEDHPLEYGSFEGVIPEGEYGAGTVTIWDSGTYDCEAWTDREVKVTLHGSRVEGRYALFATRGDDWMIHRMDPVPGWQPLPQLVPPMLAVAGSLPEGEGWGYELKWDGMRAAVYVEGGRARVLSRNGLDVTGTYPELQEMAAALGTVQAVLDGEIVAFDATGRPSFATLQERMHVTGSARVRRVAERVPVSYLAFDVLHLQGHATVDLPYRDRRSLLESLHLEGPRWATPPWHEGPGAAVLRAATDAGLEGVVAKRLDSPYRPGQRSRAWVKVKEGRTQEVVIGGWTAGEGGRGGTIGALLLGIPDGGGLRYVGKVGTGFDEATLRDLSGRLRPLARGRSPFTAPLPAADAARAHWVAPELVGEVRYGELTRDGRLRHPTWRGLRPDKGPGEVVREP
ncbi:MAG TPA: non-homologous end-joining DNA ligase [Acidimicrobiales bacterium]|nr:non-homologous end-joining DNA ligase [Acidimicrobiales bacterium]